MTGDGKEADNISMTNTKKEMIEAYNSLLKQLKEKQKSELKPDKQLADMKKKEVMGTAESLSVEKVATEIGSLKFNISNTLGQISDKLEKEVNKFQDIKRAIEIKEKELDEIYGIEREAATLAALIESNNQKKIEYETQMSVLKENLSQDVAATKETWEREKKENEALDKEVADSEEKRRKREKEDFDYNLKREQQLIKDKYDDDKSKLEKELQEKKTAFEKEYSQREKEIVSRENEFSQFKKSVEEFPQELEAAVSRAVKETTEKLKEQSGTSEALLKKEFDGERNVLMTRIESLEKTVEKQNEQLLKLSEQQEMAYQKVQDIALKAVEGSSNLKAMTNLQQHLEEASKRSSQDK